jgi:hypothetical protein
VADVRIFQAFDFVSMGNNFRELGAADVVGDTTIASEDVGCFRTFGFVTSGRSATPLLNSSGSGSPR